MTPSAPFKIKVCGMRSPQNILEVAALRPDYMGFIMYERSPRFCGESLPVALEALPRSVSPVLVAVNMDIHVVRDLADRFDIHTLQLHGDESPEYCRALRESGKTVWKALGVSDARSLCRVSRYAGATDMIVLDTASKMRGGTGRKFDWDILLDWNHPVDYILSGGIAEDDAEAIIRLRKDNANFKGIDLNSRFEISPAIKNVDSLARFIETLRKSENE